MPVRPSIRNGLFLLLPLASLLAVGMIWQIVGRTERDLQFATDAALARAGR